MAKFLPIFKGATGLNNVEDPTRVIYDPETGIGDLAIAYNVDIDINGQVSRRPGWLATDRTEAVKDIFCEGGECLYVSGTYLRRLNRDYSYKGVRSGLTAGAKMEYAQAGDRIFYTNGFEIGWVKEGISYVWEKGTYVGPDTSRNFSNPPIGTLLEFFASRVFMVVGKVVFWSEGFNWGAFDLARNFLPYSSNIIMLKSVNDGMYLSTEATTYFLAGRNPREWEQMVVSTYPAIRGTVTRVDGSFLGQGVFGKVVVWATPKGFVAGMDGGRVEDLSSKKLLLPEVGYGCAAALGRRYVCLLKR